MRRVKGSRPIRSLKEGSSSARADPCYEEKTSGRCTGASQRPLRDQPADELMQERSQVTPPTPPAEVVVPEPELALDQTELPRHKKWTIVMKLDILRKYCQVTENETNRIGYRQRLCGLFRSSTPSFRPQNNKWLIN